MPFCFSPKESVRDGLKRIVNEEIDQAIKDIDNPRLKRSEAVHEVRKHCKKVRGVLRLVRPQFEETYQFENAWFRDSAKGLAELRDAEALIETYDDLLDKFRNQIDQRAFVPIRRKLIFRQKQMIESGDLNQRLKKIRARMARAASRVSKWKLSLAEFDAIEAGPATSYRQARKAMSAAYNDPAAENFHEWRKQAKYHDFHVRLLRGLWKPIMHSVSKETDELSDLLGNDHNLDVLHKTLLESPKTYGKKRDIQVLLGLIDRRSAELRVEANRGTNVRRKAWGFWPSLQRLLESLAARGYAPLKKTHRRTRRRHCCGLI